MPKENDNPPAPKQDGPDVPLHKQLAQGKSPPVTGPKTPA